MIRHFVRGMALRCAVLVALSGAFVATAAPAQSLGDVAKAEQSRRARVTAGKVYTNGSLPAVEPAPALPSGAPAAPEQSSTQSGAQPAAGSGSSDGGATAAGKDEPEKDEAYWRKRLQEQRDALARAQSFAEALQSRINALSADFVNRDDPAQRNIIAADRQKALLELERVQKEIRDYTKGIADTQQEARRTGVPAGWVR